MSEWWSGFRIGLYTGWGGATIYAVIAFVIFGHHHQ